MNDEFSNLSLKQIFYKLRIDVLEETKNLIEEEKSSIYDGYENDLPNCVVSDDKNAYLKFIGLSDMYFFI